MTRRQRSATSEHYFPATSKTLELVGNCFMQSLPTKKECLTCKDTYPVNFGNRTLFLCKRKISTLLQTITEGSFTNV